MKRYIFLCIVWLCVVNTMALAKGPVWNHGKLYLMNGTVLEGQLNYNWKAEIVQIRQGEGIKSYSAFQVESFKYFDNIQNTIRKFVAFNYPVKPTLRRPVFLEECLNGPLMVYRRLRHLRDAIPVRSPLAYDTDEGLVSDLDNFTYYVVEADIVHSLDGFGHNLWPRLWGEFGNELKRYGDSLHMDLDNTLARLLLINHYNSLKQIAQTTPANDLPAVGQ